jgi:hypothetical protein
MLNESTRIRVYETLRKDPKSQIERKIRKLLTKRKTAVSSALKHKLTPYQSKAPHFYKFQGYTNLASPLDQ